MPNVPRKGGIKIGPKTKKPKKPWVKGTVKQVGGPKRGPRE